jgi:two-component system OmpR family response regulator
MRKAEILVVDDDQAVRDMICDALNLAGFQAASAANGNSALELLRQKRFDLLVTDINMPGLDGYALVEKLRTRGDNLPVIFLSARNEKPDVNRGLRIGADDYITKPFGLEELTLRIGAILRRTMPVDQENTELTCGPVKINLETYSVSVGDTKVDLSPTEFRLLAYLVENKNLVLTKHALLDEIWGLGFAENSGVVDTFISYLRKKLHINGFEGIKTVRGIGFQIVDQS